MKSLIVLAILVFSLPGQLLAVSEENYLQTFEEEIYPFFSAPTEEGLTRTPDGINLKYRYFLNPDSDVVFVLLQGWTESIPKYAEMIYDLHQAGISVFALDWRGQGESDRVHEDRHLSYVLDYQVYVQDLKHFIENEVKPRTQRPLVGFAHSMGANILSLYMKQEPQTFEKVILSSPMLDVRTDPYPEWFAWTIARVFELIGKGDSYLFGHGPFNGEETNIVTTSETRFRRWFNYKVDNPELIVNGGSFSWLRASIEATWAMKEHAGDLKVPILMLQAGQDLFVETEGQDVVCSKAASCRKVFFPQAKHEIMQEVDAIRDEAFKEIVAFIESDETP